MTREPKDEYMVYVPDSATLPRLVFSYAAVDRALDELGRRAARVRRVTEGEINRDITSQFAPKAILDYPEDGDWKPAHTRRMVNIGSFGRR